MSAITPQTELRLVKCPIESDNRNQMTFASATAQYNYFNGLPHLEVDNFTYQRKDSTIRYPAHIDTILSYNYVMYKNENYSNKWFYAFITKMEYVNDNMTLITIHTDVYQTWMFQMTWKKSFVEREHVNDDTVGKHTVPEGLETGEYINQATVKSNKFDDLCIVTASTVGPSDLESYSMNMYNKIPSPVVYCRWDMNSTSLNNLKTFLDNLNRADKISAMQYMFFAPTWLCPKSAGTVYIEESNSMDGTTLEVDRITNLDGYVPKNNKLLCMPYCYYGLSNSMGQFNALNPELWKGDPLNDNALTIDIFAVLTAGCSIKAIPYNYKGVTLNYDEGITLGKYPQLSWSNDLYTNWQTQNGINIGGIRLNATEAGLLKGGIQTAVGLAQLHAGDVSGAYNTATGLAGVYNTMQEEYRHSLMPNAVEGCLNSGDVTTIAGGNQLFVYTYTIKKEYAKIIDNYMSMYGYKVNEVKIPNITGRTNWNYVKTIGANIQGDIPEDHLNEIISIFNNGVTLWHNASTYLDYSQSNAIVS